MLLNTLQPYTESPAKQVNSAKQDECLFFCELWLTEATKHILKPINNLSVYDPEQSFKLKNETIQTGTCTNIYCGGEHTDVIFKSTVYNLRMLALNIAHASYVNGVWVMICLLRAKPMFMIAVCLCFTILWLDWIKKFKYNAYSDLRRIAFTKNHFFPE